MILGQATRVMSLRDGRSKMSKSDASENSRINLTDDAETIQHKIRRAKTDSEPGMSYDPENRPEATNLLGIYAALADENLETVALRYADDRFSNFRERIDRVIVYMFGQKRMFKEPKSGLMHAILFWGFCRFCSIFRQK